MQDRKFIILCVDDDPDVLVSLKIVLNSGGYSVVTAANGSEGIQVFKNSNPDLVILDLMMEEVDAGALVVKEMKALNPKVPIYMLSSSGDYLQGATDCDQLGLAGVFQKPINPNVLLGLLRMKLKS